MGQTEKEVQTLLRKLPSMHLLIKALEEDSEIFQQVPYILIKKAAEQTLNCIRKEILQSGGKIKRSFELEEIKDEVIKRAKQLNLPSLRPVVNASGTIIHTNLGRSVLPEKAIKSLLGVSSRYSNLEYDLKEGERGSRYVHVIELLKELTGAEDAIVVNNNAAAVLLVLNTFARGKEVIVSRGEMVEIGGSFRIPEVMKASGARLVEVGATNKTYLQDYQDAITEDTAMLLKAHTSNYRVLGFTASVSVEELVRLAEKNNLLAFEDLGSGVVVDLNRFGIDDEPTVKDSIEKGAHLVSFSGDKLLGGPQAGVVVGKKKFVRLLKKNQLTRALRVDKFTIAALEATLSLYLEPEKAVKEIPTLQMLNLSQKELKTRAEELKNKLEAVITDPLKVSIIRGTSRAGGGALPLKELPTFLVGLDTPDVAGWERELRTGEPPVVARIQKGRLLFDVRTLLKDDMNLIVRRIKEIIQKNL